MSQGQILEILEKSKKPLTAKDLDKIMNKNTASCSLRQLMKYKEVRVIYKTRGNHNVSHYFI